MPSDDEHPLAPLVNRLSRWANLNDDDRRAALSLPFIERRIDAGHYVVREGDEPARSCLLRSGLAFRQKLTGAGRRQILSIHVGGDLVDLQNSLLGRADHSVQMLTRGDVALIPVKAVREIAFDRPTIGMAMWYETLVDGSISREWILNIGQRGARERIAHLLCEFALRLEATDSGTSTGYDLPMTQEQLADATGLTPVHINRMLKGLTIDGLIERTQRTITIGNWAKLAEVGDFNAEYLHLDQTPIAER